MVLISRFQFISPARVVASSQYSPPPASVQGGDDCVAAETRTSFVMPEAMNVASFTPGCPAASDQMENSTLSLPHPVMRDNGASMRSGHQPPPIAVRKR